MSRVACLLLAFALGVSGQSYREQRLTSDLQQDPQNLAKTLELASLKLEDVSGVTDERERAAGLDEVLILYLRANSIDSRNVDALYHLGVVSWMKVFPAVVAARRVAAMEPETPGPVRDRNSRAVLNAKYRADIDYAIASLEQAVAIDPSHNSAMAYLQMAYRARADLKDTRSEWDQDQNAAGQWREKAWEVGSARQLETVPDPATPGGPQPSARGSDIFSASAINIDSQEMEKKLTRSLQAVCPPDLHIVGAMPAVTLSAVIDRDGSVVYMEHLDGPIEVVDAAMKAAKQWSYQPTLMNGKPTTVKTSIVVPFGPCSGN